MIRVVATLVGLTATAAVCVAVSLSQGPTPVVAVPERGAPTVASGEVVAPAATPPWLGVVVPTGEVEVGAPPAGGRIAAVLVDLGDHVEAGAVMARLDPERARAAIIEAQARLAAREAERRQAIARRAQARDRLDRIQKLGAIVAAGERSEASIAVDAAQADVDRAAAESRVQRVLIDQLDATLRDTTVVAPIAGEISARLLDAGAQVQGGGGIVRLVGAGRMLRIAVPPDERAPVVGDAIDARCGDRAVRAVVTQVAPDVDAAARVVLVEARVEPGVELRLGDDCSATRL